MSDMCRTSKQSSKGACPFMDACRKPLSRIHIDHAVNFMEQDWLVLHQHQVNQPSNFSKKIFLTLDHHTQSSVTMQCHSPQRNSNLGAWNMASLICQERPYHPATNAAAERLVQSFKRSVRKSSLASRSAILEFLISNTLIECYFHLQ